MAGSIIQIYITTSDRLPDLTVKDGQLIFVKDVKKIYLDYGSLRTEYSVLQTVDTEKDRENMDSPAEGFYFVEETSRMWWYKNKWVPITPSNLEPVFIGDYDSFPTIGRENTLYVTEDGTYIWSNKLNDYLLVASKTEWQTLN